MLSVLCWRNRYSNLFGMIIVDSMLDQDKQKENEICKFYLLSRVLELDGRMGLLDDILWERFDRVKKITGKIHEENPGGENWKKYYRWIVKPCMIAIVDQGAWAEIFKDKEWRRIARKLQLPQDLNEDVVQFLIEDVMDYVEGCDCSQYNPMWIFGSACYEKILQDVWSWDWEILDY